MSFQTSLQCVGTALQIQMELIVMMFFALLEERDKPLREAVVLFINHLQALQRLKLFDRLQDLAISDFQFSQGREIRDPLKDCKLF